jgi:hypothetical protein
MTGTRMSTLARVGSVQSNGAFNAAAMPVRAYGRKT